ncbi:MAG: ribonuclease R [Bacteroidales bacterium]|jgi:ribonuclease R|nr:ribonuclease R [Bacteroidales bacterium]HOI32155.1 ribonuclease R [Bacteroidales bacterium]
MAKKKSTLGTKSTFTNTILSIFGEQPFKPFNYKQISKLLGIKDKAGKDLIDKILRELLQEGKLREERPYRYVLSKEMLTQIGGKSKLTIGKVDMKSTGKAYVIPEDGGEDIFIAANNTGQALHEDLVKVALFPKRKNKKTEGQIVEILQRTKTDFVGVLTISRDFGFVVPDSQHMPMDIFVPKSALNKAKNGDKVVVRIGEWPEQSKNPFGEVIHVLGRPGENNVEMQSILAEYHYPLQFPAAVEKEAAAISEKVSSAEMSSRKDFRKIFTITIDPADAKDFDDALSLRKLETGNWEVGVHIADVSHYVKPGTALDEEAKERGTSVYLVDRVIPMLPEKLSNGVCSLRPNEDKRCFSAVFEMNEQAEILDEWIGKTLINSNRRYAYEEVQAMIEGGEGDYKDEIMLLHQLAEKLRAKRMANGSINFHSEEVKFILDENSKPIDTYVKVQQESHMLIEDFMLLANLRVAEKIGKVKGRSKAKTFVYRIHDEPNPEKLNTFTQMVSRLGYKMDISSRQKLVKSYNSLFEAVEGKGEKTLIETVAIRTMAKAEYSTENIGHYGLAFPFYTHFTSPIRRYPDLLVHRLLERYLIENKPSVSPETYEPICQHASEMERRAAEMERDSVKYKQAEYLSDKIGKVFDGQISGVSKWGLFVELKTSKCEGLVRYSEMPGDFYYLDEENFRVIGQEFGKIFRLGDPVKIKVKKVDLLKKQMDFQLMDTDQARSFK